MGIKKDILIKRKGFKIPEGYFESINNDFYQIEKIEVNRFLVPKNYFKSIDKQQVFNRIYINRVKYLKTNFYRAVAAVFIGILFLTNNLDKTNNLNSEDIIEYVNQDMLYFSSSDLSELFASNELNYTFLINDDDIEKYFIEANFNTQEYLLQE